MVLQWQSVGEHETSRINAACLRFHAQVPLRTGVVAQQPQHAAFDRMQEPHPDAEYVGCDLPVVVEAAEDKTLLRKPDFLSRWRPLGDPPLGVVNLIAIRQVNDLLCIKRLMFERRHRLVGDNIVNELGPHRAGKAEIAYLDRRWTIRKNAEPKILRVPLQINRNVDL